jgi:predicted deacylase
VTASASYYTSAATPTRMESTTARIWRRAILTPSGVAYGERLSLPAQRTSANRRSKRSTSPERLAMGRSERAKGARGENEVAAIFRARGFLCERVPASGGFRLKGDVYGNVPFHVEVKRCEVARPWSWMLKAETEAQDGNTPVVAFRRNNGPWYAMIPLDALAELADKARRT